jgi:hypothetical protein
VHLFVCDVPQNPQRVVIGGLSIIDSARVAGDIVHTHKESSETKKYNSLFDNCQYSTACFGFTRSSSGTCIHKNIMRHLYVYNTIKFMNKIEISFLHRNL